MLAGVFAVLAMAQVQTPARPNPCPPAKPIPRTADGTALGTIGAMDANVIEAAKLATTKASSGEVKAFAATLVREHQVSLARGDSLAKRYGITRLLPADSAMARDHREGMTSLNLLSGNAFDTAFMRMMVSAHKAQIAKIDKSLIVMARQPEVKTFIRRQVPDLKAHEHAADKWLDAHS